MKEMHLFSLHTAVLLLWLKNNYILRKYICYWHMLRFNLMVVTDTLKLYTDDEQITKNLSYQIEWPNRPRMKIDN